MHPSTKAPPQLSEDAEAQARRALRRNRAWATALLLAMVALFAATSLVANPGFPVLLVRAAAEAGIVGGMADWFAVTALFRHPLGLPIPHTAILPRNKDRIGRALGSFIERSFLTPDVLLPKLRQMQAARRLAEWLATPAAARLVAQAVTSSLPQIIRSLENSDLRDFVRRSIGAQFRDANVAPLLGRALQALTASGEADTLFERLLDAATGWLQENRGEFEELVQQRSRWWIPKTLDRRLATAIVDGGVEILLRLRQPDSDARHKLTQALSELVHDLMHAPEKRELCNAMVARLLDHPETQAWLGSVWKDLSGTLLRDLERPDSMARLTLEGAIRSLGRTLADDHAMQKRIDDFVEDIAGQAISWRGEISRFIVEVVESWDARTLSDRLELIIGNDLQYIRMNGSIVGAFVGCLIFLIGSFFS
jgi:uncharacterized membrane-anchored protein YjiN (DUF445 family)